MNHAPEKIWVKEGYDSWGRYGNWYRDSNGGGTGYTRTDIADARIEKLEEALRFYATPHAIPNDGPWGVNSKDYGYIASIALGETT
jgi:hypothetical protein